ncbi:hypothetical protein BJX99DRAFT_216886 [Aspergillus californicus]
MPAQLPPPPSVSPVVPIRSMFPLYNPDAPAQRHQRAASNNFSRPRKPSLKIDTTPAPDIDRVLGPKTVPADLYDFPSDVLDAEIQYSSTAQLKSLWEITNGRRPDDSGNFHLRMERINPATFVFGDPNSPFYIMQTFSTNEISITRGNPYNPNNNIPIMMLQLADRRRREASDDGLVSHLFSRLAAMLAIDQATELSRQHQLSPPDAAEVEANALRRAAALESCKLSWNATKRAYELHHPSLRKQQTQRATPPALVGAAGIALSPTRPQYASGALQISVSTPTIVRGQPQAPTIVVTAPLPNNAVEGATAIMASPRISTLPLSGSQSDSDDALASLDLRTMTLSISASAICNTIPSLYAIDSIVAAILAVAMSDLSTNPVLADMHLYDPNKVKPPTPPQPAYTNTNNRPQLFATLAERDDLDADTNAGTRSLDLPQIHPRTQTQPQTRRSWLSLSPLRSKIAQIQHSRRQKAKSKSKAIASTDSTPVAEEIDLEKYGIRSSASAAATSSNKKIKDNELPGLARGLIKLFLWGLKLVFWALGVAFKILEWAFKVVLRAITGEKA